MYDFSDDGRFFMFSNIPAATAAEIARHSQLSSSCQVRRSNGPAGTLQITPAGSFSFLHAGRTPCCANSLRPSTSVVLPVHAGHEISLGEGEAAIFEEELNGQHTRHLKHKVKFDYLTLMVS
jgi:hypothetical protein